METLPDELICWIAGYLSAHDTTQLMQVSKRFDNLITPTLWNTIELHSKSHHLKRDSGYPAAMALNSQRPYFYEDDGLNNLVAENFFKTLDCIAFENRTRFKLLASRIQSLCCDVSPDWVSASDDDTGVPSIWDVFPNLVNLKFLDLYSDWSGPSDSSKLFEPEIAPLQYLRLVRLFGYFPRHFVSWILSAGRTLERVELGLLDRPISSILYGRAERNRPLPEENLLLDEDDDESLYEGSDYGSLDGEVVAPRPLGGFLPNTKNTIGSECSAIFPALKHLYLSQPSRCDFGHSCKDYNWSTRAEVACLTEWKKLLLATGPTLEVLVLDQRPVAEAIEMDTFGCTEWVLNNRQGVGSESLVDMIIECISVKNHFPHLQKVYLSGIAVGTEQGCCISRVPRDTTPGSKLMWFLQERGIFCEARLGIWTVFDADDGAICWREHYTTEEDGRLMNRRSLLATTKPESPEAPWQPYQISMKNRRGTQRGGQ